MIPNHLALIPDGNRRWARARGLGPTDGHRAGIRQVGRVAAAAWQAGVQDVTFWWGSPANLTLRDPTEVAGIVGALADWLREDGAELLRSRQARFAVFGRWRELCPSLEPALAEAQAAAGPGPLRLTLLMAYDGREELQAAAEAFAAAGATGSLGAHLWTAALPPVDLLLRTGGQPHLSAGFLAWGMAEAQLCFSDRLWPEVDEQVLQEALEGFARTERRFGR